MTTGFQLMAEVRRVEEKFKGYFDTGKTRRKGKNQFYPGEFNWQDRCKHYDELVEKHGLIRQGMFTIAGQLLGKAKDGVFLEPAVNKSTKKPYDRALDALNKCEELNDRIALPLMIYELGHTLPKYGSHFWEKTLTPVFDVRLAPMQEKIEPAEADELNNITRWRQRSDYGRSKVEWPADMLVHYSWNVTTRSWPYGTPLIVGLETECDALLDLETHAEEYMEKQAWPYEMWGVGDGQYVPTPSEVSSLRSKWKNREIGENMITSYPIEIKQGGTGGAPIRELSNLVSFMKENIIDSTLVPPVSMQHNATEASAKVMMPWALANLIWPMQRMIKWKIENEIYKPYLEHSGFSVRTCPSLLFEPPDAHKEDDAEYYSKLSPGEVIIPPKAAAKELGYEEEFEEWMKEQKERDEREQALAKQQQEGEDEGKSYRVTEVYRREKKLMPSGVSTTSISTSKNLAVSYFERVCDKPGVTKHYKRGRSGKSG